MKKKDSEIVKGIAVLCMYFHHLYWTGVADRYEKFHLTGLIGSAHTTQLIGDACKVCVYLFVFVSAYGITLMKGNECTEKHIYDKNQTKRLIRFMKGFGSCFLFCLVLSHLFHLNHGAVQAWGESRINCLIGILGNVTGLAGVAGIAWFNASWWYVSLAILLMFLVPVLHIAVKKIGLLQSVIITLFIVPFLGLNTATGQAAYLLIAVLGVVSAEGNILENLGEYLKERNVLNAFLICAVVVSICVLVILRPRVSASYLVNTIMAVLIVTLVSICIRYIPLISSGFAFLGRHCMYMWLTHSFFTSYWFQKHTYSFRNIWLILFVLVIETLSISLCIFMFNKVISKFSKHFFHRTDVTNVS